MKKYILFVTLPLLFLSAGTYKKYFKAEVIDPEIMGLVLKLDEYGRVTEFRPVDYFQYGDEYRSSYLVIKNHASMQDLVMLSRHPSATIRGYAFIVLKERDLGTFLKLKEEHKNDRELVMVGGGCSSISFRFKDWLNRLETRNQIEN